MSRVTPGASALASMAHAETTGKSAGLSNDYLNHYNEVLMLIEAAPHDPSLSDDLAGWWPLSYLDYFSASALHNAAQARAAFETLPAALRHRFERHVSAMETLATLTVFALQPPCETERAAAVVDAAAPVLRRLIDTASAFLNDPHAACADQLPVEQAEAVIDAIVAMRPAASADTASADGVTSRSPREALPIRVLVVEDDAMLRELYGKALRRAGYQVLTADNGEVALAILREWGERVDWLVTDVRLPGSVDGWAVGAAFRSNHPFRPIVYGSGLEPGAARADNSVFLRKPINMGELVAALEGLNAAYLRQASGGQALQAH